MLPLHISILFYSFFFFLNTVREQSASWRELTFLYHLIFALPNSLFPCYVFPYTSAIFSRCFHEETFFFFFDNVKVLFHVKDHQSFQVSLLLKIETNWCCGRVVIFCSQRGSNWEDFFRFEVPEWLMRWVQKSWFLHRSFQIL